ncbi:MAG: DUF3365 domain-containing protein [Opitutaceae bacterium]|nr:DUF3365 domain-containing protein [Opitutaceae bacterium]
MKWRHWRRFGSLAGCLTGLAVGAAETETFRWVDTADPTAAAILAAGDRAIDHYGRALLSEVKRTLNTTTPALAVGKLHLPEYKLPAAAAGQPAAVAIRRTSLKLRSPANAPDAGDLAALNLIREKLDAGDDVPKILLQKVESPGQPPEWRVYRPLGLTPQCLSCHGPGESLDPDVKSALLRLYPADKAVDFTPGAWRGVIRASIAAAAKP